MSDFKQLLSGNVTFIKSPFYIKYGVPFLLLVWATLFKLLLFETIGQQSPFVFYLVVIVLTARYFGEKAAIVTSIFTTLTVNYFFLYPYSSFSTDLNNLVQNFLFFVECGLVVGLSGTLRKTTERMHQRDMVFRALVEKSSEGITMHSADGIRIYCSPSVEGIMGYTAAELLQHQPWELSHEGEVLDAKEQFYRLASHPGQTVTVLHRVKHKNGKWIWLESRLTNLLNDPSVNAIISNFSDVTDRINLEKQREDFIGVASHELKTPLTSLKAYTQVLENRFRTNADKSSHQIINKIDQQVNRIVIMINDMLDVSSLQAGGLHFNIARFDINALITKTTQTILHTNRTHHFVTGLIPIGEIPGDQERIRQVITNFVLNAIKYSPDANIINITTTTDGESITVSVKDQGIGISAIDQKSIFEKFYKVGKSQKAFQGLGLGLFICAQIIEMHKGRIGVISEEGKGSTFWFSLPL